MVLLFPTGMTTPFVVRGPVNDVSKVTVLVQYRARKLRFFYLRTA